MTTPRTPSIIQKPWGVTRNVGWGIWHASIKAGGYSSRHRHLDLHNVFYVVSGQLQVIEWDGEEKCCHLLEAGGTLLVPEKRWHRFVALTDVELVEHYLGDNAHSPNFSIERSDQGGIRQCEYSA